MWKFHSSVFVLVCQTLGNICTGILTSVSRSGRVGMDCQKKARGQFIVLKDNEGRRSQMNQNQQEQVTYMFVTRLLEFVVRLNLVVDLSVLPGLLWTRQ